MIALFWNLALALLVLALHCYCGDTVKYGLVSKHLFQTTIWRLKKFHSNDKILEKVTFPVITWNKKHSWKQVASITYIVKEIFFVAAAFKGL